MIFKTNNHVVDSTELLNRSHRVRTLSGENYINHLNGLFYSTKGNDVLTLNEIYPKVKSAFTTDRQVFAKRRRLNSPLLGGRLYKK